MIETQVGFLGKMDETNEKISWAQGCTDKNHISTLQLFFS